MIRRSACGRRATLPRLSTWLVGTAALLVPAQGIAQTDPAKPDAAADAQAEARVQAATEAAARAQEAAERAEAVAARLAQTLEQQQARIDAQQAQISQAEQAAADAQLAADAAIDQAAAVESAASEARERFRIYGFTDVGIKKTYLNDGASWRNIMPEANTFVLGNINLYFDAKPVEGFRALTEVRFTRYPYGAEYGTDFQRTDTTVWDENSPTGRNKVQWSGVVVERAWLEWNDIDAFRVRAGYWLTPYGIWNVDHGTPVLISLALPDFFAGEYLPTHQLGLQVLGSFPTGAWELGYHATVSNGRTEGQLDETDDKALGGRLFARYEDATRITVGTSGYMGRYSERTKQLVGVNPLRVEGEETVAYDEYALAADISLDVGPVRVRTEGVMQRLAYEEGKRASYGPGAFYRDFYRYNYYGLVAYELPWYPIEPYGYFEHRIDGVDDMIMLSYGINVRFNEAAQVKLQYGYLRFLDREGTNDDFRFADTRFVMVF